jgi:hypothetical protein
MNIDDLVRRYPRIYHMAERESWASIQRHGLLSTSAILDLLEIPVGDRELYEQMHRPQKNTLVHGVHGAFVLRDQKPMNNDRLTWCLQDNLTPSDWYRVLNSKVFFWVSEARLLRLLGARAYRNEEHDVLTIDSAPLIRVYAERIRLAHINTGNTFPYPANRGLNTFKTIEDYPTRRDRVTPAPEIVELVVEGGVPDIAEYVLRVDRMMGANLLGTIYEHGA